MLAPSQGAPGISRAEAPWLVPGDSSYYREALASVHHQGFGAHADACAPGILRLLDSLQPGRDLVVELGCGSGRLTQHLVAAGHRVIATDASPAMLHLAREAVPEADLRLLVLPDDPIPDAQAIVSVGHVLNYLADEHAVERAFGAIARALRPGGVLALDLCDLEWGVARRSAPIYTQVTDAWAIITRFSTPTPARFVREITVFIREPDGCWRRDDERHGNVLVNSSAVPSFLAIHGVDATVRSSFGIEELPVGLSVIVGQRRQTSGQR
jgi:SAM-dependent methyltransferase